MKTKLFRLFLTLAAFLIGAGIVTALSYAGEKTRGPITDLFDGASTVVHTVEEKVIVKQRQHTRSDDLLWYKATASQVASLRHPKTILLGAFDNQTQESFQSIVDLEDSLHTKFPLMQIYCAWGSKADENFPKLKVTSILELGSTPVITWEPWLTDFDAVAFPDLRKPEERDKGGMADVAKGAYDIYIRKWAADAKAVGRPIFLRVGHEMNDPYRYPWGPQNNTAKDFIAAWRHIHAIFAQEGANNILWIWSPHPAYGYFDAFYPGNDVVDYVGLGTLNYGTVATWSKWWSFTEIFGNHYAELAKFGKPIMLTEFGSLSVGGQRNAWFADALNKLPQTYPAVKALIFFHYSDDKTTTQQALNWYFKSDKASTKAIINAISLWPDSTKGRNR